jgi:hypothetical protein
MAREDHDLLNFMVLEPGEHQIRQIGPVSIKHIQHFKTCSICGHREGFKRNETNLNQWLCSCNCHKEEEIMPKKIIKELQLKKVNNPVDELEL